MNIVVSPRMERLIMNCGIIVAAGRSERMGAKMDKAFLSLGPQPVLAWSMMAFEECTDIDEVILVVRREQLAAARGVASMFGCSKVTQIVSGGAKRQVSVQNGIDALHEDARFVVVHDGARPCITPDVISATLKTARRYGSGVVGVKMTDTVKLVEKGLTIKETIDRNILWAVQTPQTFKLSILQKALTYAQDNDLTVTDESQAVELSGEEVHLVASPAPNMKITTPDDLPVAAALLGIGN